MPDRPIYLQLLVSFKLLAMGTCGVSMFLWIVRSCHNSYCAHSSLVSDNPRGYWGRRFARSTVLPAFRADCSFLWELDSRHMSISQAPSRGSHNEKYHSCCCVCSINIRRGMEKAHRNGIHLSLPVVLCLHKNRECVQAMKAGY